MNYLIIFLIIIFLFFIFMVLAAMSVGSISFAFLIGLLIGIPSLLSFLLIFFE